MQTLDTPLFEVNQDSNFYKQSFNNRAYHRKISEVLEELGKEFGFNSAEFRYYGPFGFGFYDNCEEYDKFKDELVKKSDRNGVYTFKKTSKLYKAISKRLAEVPESNYNPFAAHDVFGANNLKASQWIGDRLFYGVKEQKETEQAVAQRAKAGGDNVEPVLNIETKEYLQLILEKMNDEESQETA